MRSFLPEGSLLHTAANQTAIQTMEGLRQAMPTGQILEARAIACDSSYNLLVDLPGIRGIIPHQEGAMGIPEGTTRDIALISRAGKPVCFQVMDFTLDEQQRPLVLLSRRRVQELCWKTYLSLLHPGDIIPAKVTHLERFGCFVDIGCGIPSLIPIDTISVSRIAHPKDRFVAGQSIRAIVRSVGETKICLSHKELLGTWEENAAQFSAGETVVGIVRSVESYGIFVELTPNLAGLAELKEQVLPGQCASVYIKALIPEKMKVKLVLVDVFENDLPPAPLHYFVQQSHLSGWQYAPDCCAKKRYLSFEEPEDDSK